MGTTKTRISQAEVAAQKERKRRRKAGEKNVRASKSPFNPQRIADLKAYNEKVQRSFGKKENGNFWIEIYPNGVNGPPEHYKELKVKSSEDWAAYWYYEYTSNINGVCFWNYLLSPSIIPKSFSLSTATELKGFGKEKILCFSWLDCLKDDALRIKLVRLAHKNSKTMGNAKKQVRKAFSIIELNSNRLITYINLLFNNSNLSIVRLAQFHACFDKKIDAEVADFKYNLLDKNGNNLLGACISTAEEFRTEDYTSMKEYERDAKDRNEFYHVTYVKYLHRERSTIIVSGLMDQLYRFGFDAPQLETYSTFYRKDIKPCIEKTDSAPLMKLHIELQTFLRNALQVSPANAKKSKLICPFHSESQDQLCCILILETNELLKILGGGQGYKLLTTKRKNSPTKLYFLGPVPSFLSS